MTDKAYTDMLAEISRFLQYHKSLGISGYPHTGMLERFLAGHQEDRRPLPGSSKHRFKEKLSKPAEQKHSFDQALTAKATLRDVREELGDCQRCPLKKTRTSIVFGQGPPSAKLMIIADAPSLDDDRQGNPLQGDAGELLDKMLAAINLSRDEVYITTLVKCFPGNQAQPRENEIKTCLPFLFRQIEIICPAVICAMGTLSGQTLLHSRKSIFQLRGRFYNFNDLCSATLAEKIVVLPSLPPALLMTNHDLKKASWQDLQMIQKKLEGN